MVLERRDPFRELRRMERTMDHLWRGFGARDGVEHWIVPLDVVQDGEQLVVNATVPGVKPEEIQVTVEDRVLTIGAETKAEREEGDGNYLLRERRAGKFRRALRLPETVDADKAETAYENGVLTITFPKLEAKRAKRLEIKAA